LDNLTITYRDISGRLRLRRYVVVSLGILLILAAVFGVSRYQRYQMISVVTSPPQTLAAAPQRQMAVLPASQSPVNTPQPAPEPCETDAELWNLVDQYPEDNLKGIEPRCVYEGLGRTAAWEMLLDAGYTHREAADALKIRAIPQLNTQDTFKVYTNYNGPLDVKVIHRLNLEINRTWRLDAEGVSPDGIWTLLGCFRTKEYYGSEVRYWADWPVICSGYADKQAEWTAAQMGSVFASNNGGHKEVLRFITYYGYLGGGEWLSLGYVAEPYTLTRDEADADRTRRAEKFGLPLWDSAWLEGTFNVAAVPMPENWQSFSGQEYLDQLSEATIKWKNEHQGIPW
jgi:hypothetical protein